MLSGVPSVYKDALIKAIQAVDLETVTMLGKSGYEL
jgi:hypothetical protein